jgi:hypothetical protein
MARDISNTQDIIDSRDIVARMEELENELHDAHVAEHEKVMNDEALTDEDRATVPDPVNFDEWLDYVLTSPDGHLYEGEAEELKTLRALVEDINSSAGDDAADGVGLIRDSYFVTYAQEFHDDIHGRDAATGWPYDYIDWDRAAEALQSDYSSVEYDGVTYWVR